MMNHARLMLKAKKLKSEVVLKPVTGECSTRQSIVKEFKQRLIEKKGALSYN